jgi:5-formyltetrahydrofolate cyclo-ligase
MRIGGGGHGRPGELRPRVAHPRAGVDGSRERRPLLKGCRLPRGPDALEATSRCPGPDLGSGCCRHNALHPTLWEQAVVSFPSGPGKHSSAGQPSYPGHPSDTAFLSIPALPSPPGSAPFTPDPQPAPAPEPLPPPADAKTSLRHHFRQQRRQALAAASDPLVTAVAAELPSLLKPPSRLGLYWPVGHEPDLRPLTEQLSPPWRACLALPAIRDQRLLYLPWRPGDPLAPDEVGIPAPVAAAPLEPIALGLLLVPALAVDRSGVRLGSGGGWYDRLRSDPLWGAVPALVVVPAACVVPRLPRDPWDVPFPGWLTETGLHWTDSSSPPGASVATS